MYRTLSLLSLLLLLPLATAAHAASVVDPHAVGMGSSSLITPPEAGQEEGDDEVRVVRGIHGSSEVYIVYRGDRVVGYQSIDGRPLLPGVEPGGLLRPGVGGSDVILPDPQLRPQDMGDILTNRPRLNDPGYPGWMGLERDRKQRPGRDLPTGGDQPFTPLSPAPEPGTVMLLATGMGAVGALRIARRRWGGSVH